MEGVILSTPSNSGFRTQLKNAASMLCARTLPKQRRNEPAACSKTRHHTYPRATPPKRAAISCRMEPLMCDQQLPASIEQPCELNDLHKTAKPNGVVKFKKTLAREVANVWECRIGPPREPAPADRVQSLFNDIELYPTKSQVFEMLACARQCARRKSLTLTFGEFCVFAAELRRCSRQAKQTPSKPESPLWTVDRGDLRDKATCKHVNGSEAPPPPCEVFLGGSCNPTTWRSDIAIPLLEKMGITYFNPQVDDWSKELMEVEYKAKADARALLFVLDSETRAIGASVEAAHLAASPRDLLLVLRPYSRHQTIGDETISDQEYIELSRARATLQEAVERRGLPAFTDIPSALRCARAVIRGARTHPRHSLRHTILRLKRAYDAAGGKNARLPRPKAVDTLKEVTRVQREVADRFLPQTADTVDFETFCAAVAELTSDPGAGAARTQAGVTVSDNGVASRLRRAFRTLYDKFALNTPVLDPSPLENQARVTETESQAVAGAVAGVDAGAGAKRLTEATNGLRAYNARLRAYGRKLGLYIPKNGGSRSCAEESGGSASSGESVFTPGTARRLDQLPAMLGAPTHDVYLAGAFPTNESRPEEVLRRENFTYVVPRANDYTRMFSCPARRTAPAHPESPRTDKKPRPAVATDDKLRSADDMLRSTDVKLRPTSTTEEDVQLRSRSTSIEPVDRLSASDFYTVTENQTPQPFKGTYDEDLLLGSRVLVFSLSSEAPCLAAMVLAAHYMGLRPSNTVLLVQSMDPAAANNLQYSEAAVKDYNRGRHYLADLARRTGVPVFDNVDDAMQCVVARLRSTL